MELTKFGRYLSIAGEMLNWNLNYIKSNTDVVSNNYTKDDIKSISKSFPSPYCENFNRVLTNIRGRNDTSSSDDSYRYNLSDYPLILFLDKQIQSDSNCIIFEDAVSPIVFLNKTNIQSPNLVSDYKEIAATFKNTTTKNVSVSSIVLTTGMGKVQIGSDYIRDFGALAYENFDTPVVFEPNESKTFNIRIGLPSQS